MREEQVWRATAIMSAGTALSRASGLLRVVAMSYALGVTGTRLADTYNLANTTPNIIFELFLGGIFTAVFVPVFEELRKSGKGREHALVSVCVVALAGLSLVAGIAAPWIMRLYTFRIADPQVRQAQLELATFLLRWFAPQIFFYGLGAIAGAWLNTRRRFGPPMFTPLLNNLIVAGTFFAYARLFAEQGLDLSTGAKILLGAGTTAGVVVQALTLLPYLRREQWRFRFHLLDPAVRRVVRLAGFVIGYVIVSQIGVWVVLALANAQTGGVTAYQIAFMFFQLPHGLFAVSIVTALLPDLSGAASARDWTAYREYFATGLRGVAYLLVPAAVGYVLLAEPVARLLLAHGMAGTEDAQAVAAVLRAFAVGLPMFSAFQLLLRCSYALQDTRSPMMVKAVAVGIHIAVNFPLFAAMGVPGLALGHAVSYTCAAVLLAWRLSRRTEGLGLRALLGPLTRVMVAATALGLTVWLSGALLHVGDLATVAVGVSVGAVVYLVASMVLNIPERTMIVSALRGK